LLISGLPNLDIEDLK